MAIHKQSWFPHTKNIAVVQPGIVPYSHSLWVGLTSPILNLPLMIWEVMIVPFVGGFFTIIGVSAVAVIAGVSGRALGYDDKAISEDVPLE